MVKPSEIVKELENNFRSVEKVDDGRVDAFRVMDGQGSDLGMITHLGKNEWRIFVDNFPGQKLYFSTNLPFESIEHFIGDISRTGLFLIRKL